MAKKSWYSVRCIFRQKRIENGKKFNLYEERITIWKAISFEEAVKLAENEAKEYASDPDWEYLESAQVYQLFDEKLKSGAEVFSLMRQHKYTPSKYIDKFFDTGKERQENIK